MPAAASHAACCHTMLHLRNLGGLLLLLRSVVSAPTLKQVTYFSRHGVRTPYPPSYGTATDWRNYTDLAPPGAAAYNGMSQEAFETQQLTPHGALLIPLVGAYFREKWANASLFASAGGCDAIVAFADDSTRDVQTAAGFLEGFGCGGAAVHVANASLPVMEPVCSDHYDTGCALATEEQVAGLYGGNVGALTNAYAHLITRVQQVLQMPADAGVCRAAGAAPAAWANCTFYELPYAWTGMYWQGMFVSPLYYAQFFAEAWMFEYCSAVEPFAWGALSGAEVAELYEAHIEIMAFGSNHWNARAYGSQGLAYLVGALTQAATGASFGAGMAFAAPSDKLVALFVHDTNQLYVRELLGLSWIAHGWEGNAASTGGALVFELLVDDEVLDAAASAGGAQHYVRVSYVVASPRQQREATPLSLAAPPAEAVLVVPKCGAAL